MKMVRVFLGLAAFAGAAFFACSDNKFEPDCNEDGCGFEGDSSPSELYSSSIAGQTSSPSTPSSGSVPPVGVSSSVAANPNPSVSSSSLAGTAVSSSAARSSSSAYVPPTPSCDYQPIWCGGIASEDVKTGSAATITGNAPDGPACIFATAISKLGNENGQGGGLKVNNTKLTGNNNADVGGRCGNTDWGQQTCAAALASVAKKDGGYYIYIPSWAGDFSTTGGTPTCSTPAPQPQPTPSSSSGVRLSSSSPGGGGNSSSAGNSGGSGTVRCSNLPSNGVVNQPVAAPTVTCNGSTVPGTDINWSGAPNWNNPALGNYNNVIATPNKGNCSGIGATCPGSLQITQTPLPSSTSQAPSGEVPKLDVLNSGNAKDGKTTRYWDACKPSCAWSGNTGASPNGTAKSCDVRGNKLGGNEQSACNGGGSSYTCMDQAPWRVTDDIAYGFAATNTNNSCGKCFQLQFKNSGYGSNPGSVTGKNMVVMISNIGGDVGATQFDIMIPGGGVGQYNALSNQISQNGGTPNLGQTYGGFRSTCGNTPSCVSNMCNQNFGSSALSKLKAGCDWFVSWYNIADNPDVFYKEITCPADLVKAYK